MNRPVNQFVVAPPPVGGQRGISMSWSVIEMKSFKKKVLLTRAYISFLISIIRANDSFRFFIAHHNMLLFYSHTDCIGSVKKLYNKTTPTA